MRFTGAQCYPFWAAGLSYDGLEIVQWLVQTLDGADFDGGASGATYLLYPCTRRACGAGRARDGWRVEGWGR